MQDSTKIKYFTIVGTFTIIFTSYMLHAETYYSALEPIKRVVAHTPTITEAVKKIEESKPKVKIKKVEKIIKSEVKKPEVIQPKIVKYTKPKYIEPEPVKEKVIEPVKSTIEKVVKKEIKPIQTEKYIYLGKNSKVTDEVKKIIENSLSEIDSIDEEYYIEIEGYSASEFSSILSQRLSREYAEAVAKYLKSIGVKKKIVVTSYSDMYPIIADRFDKRNSRVELKFRKGRN
jgi:outer membrane protein OmpA-like peptidoglycan-associated protein